MRIENPVGDASIYKPGFSSFGKQFKVGFFAIKFHFLNLPFNSSFTLEVKMEVLHQKNYPAKHLVQYSM